jgi:hypothetical protein
MLLVYLIFWPGMKSQIEDNKKVWPGVIGLSFAAVIVFILFTVSSFLFGIFTIARGLSSDFEHKPLKLRVWNQTDEVLYVRFTVTDGILYQGYPVYEIRPNEIIKDENTLSRSGEYLIKVNDSNGKIFYHNSINYYDLIVSKGIILIPQ